VVSLQPGEQSSSQLYQKKLLQSILQSHGPHISQQDSPSSQHQLLLDAMPHQHKLYKPDITPHHQFSQPGSQSQLQLLSQQAGKTLLLFQSD
jgi:hypothetical protein